MIRSFSIFILTWFTTTRAESGQTSSNTVSPFSRKVVPVSTISQITSDSPTIGVIGNGDHNLVNIGKAGRKRHMGVRPTVRGSVMNPNDHPHGGGEGKAPVERPIQFFCCVLTLSI